MQNKFAFFANFAETIRAALPPERQAEAYQAICEYGIYGILPEDPMLKGMCLMAAVSINKKDGRSNNGGNHNPNGINQHQKEVNSGQIRSKEVNLVNLVNSGQSLSETETRNKKQKQETEINIPPSENKFSSVGIFSAPAAKKYAFEGKVIKLTQKDFDNWQKAYPDLNLYAECLQRDNYLAEQPPDEQKRWFLSTSAFFIKQNERRKTQNANNEQEEQIFGDDYL